jgi:hypothetical protein
MAAQQKAAENLYKTAGGPGGDQGQGGPGAGSTGGGRPGASNDDVIDAEIVDEKS